MFKKKGQEFEYSYSHKSLSNLKQRILNSSGFNLRSLSSLLCVCENLKWFAVKHNYIT